MALGGQDGVKLVPPGLEKLQTGFSRGPGEHSWEGTPETGSPQEAEGTNRKE